MLEQAGLAQRSQLVVLRGVSDFLYRPLNIPVKEWIMGPGWIDLNKDKPSFVACRNLFLTGLRMSEVLSKMKRLLK